MTNAGIEVVDLNDAAARRVLATTERSYFAESLGDGYVVGAVVGSGDVVDIGIWEAPPAVLFGSAGGDARLSSSNSTARGTTLPEQMVGRDGMLNVPFVGQVRAAGRTTQEIAREIDRRLVGKAHQPQTIVRIIRNANNNVTVVGDVSSSGRVQLTAKGERLLDVLAAVGGVKQPVGKMTIQITRGDRLASMALETVIREPRQNIRLQPDDVVTALFQPFSFTALGATTRNEEVPFEGTGINLVQALGRVAGLQDSRADVKGVFIFRFEDPAAIDPVLAAGARSTPDGKIPVIYRVNLKDPATFFVAQSFPIRNHDVLYVSNAPLADIQKFVNVISSTILPAATAATILP
ncbi:polysaccharide biosynthesis/export family protein [Novosphingobium sp. MD-1]|uniref:polysaccharide biosynthesis/export family protein n=1 Tax=Novosphingobium sp. MD-1 TaxID=1630648 RepID=UPI00061BB4C5|nr:polysaccharide biosynthesis/export family protein [Novosphingobium sp. MD-1]GAO54879.1 capsular polysaccharide biosynthesis/export periplasmic protein wcbC [Novosphingobium sp. MD-1]